MEIILHTKIIYLAEISNFLCFLEISLFGFFLRLRSIRSYAEKRALRLRSVSLLRGSRKLPRRSPSPKGSARAQSLCPFRALSFRRASETSANFSKKLRRSPPAHPLRITNSGRSPCLLRRSPSRFTSRMLRCRVSAFPATLLRSVASGSELSLRCISSPCSGASSSLRSCGGLLRLARKPALSLVFLTGRRASSLLRRLRGLCFVSASPRFARSRLHAPSLPLVEEYTRLLRRIST